MNLKDLNPVDIDDEMVIIVMNKEGRVEWQLNLSDFINLIKNECN